MKFSDNSEDQDHLRLRELLRGAVAELDQGQTCAPQAEQQRRKEQQEENKKDERVSPSFPSIVRRLFDPRPKTSSSAVNGNGSRDERHRALEHALSMEKNEARHFLQQLDPDSQEGMWFDAIAERFPTRLDAALAYLREVKRCR